MVRRLSSLREEYRNTAEIGSASQMLNTNLDIAGQSGLSGSSWVTSTLTGLASTLLHRGQSAAGPRDAVWPRDSP
jgi:hypothetical protein